MKPLIAVNQKSTTELSDSDRMLEDFNKRIEDALASDDPIMIAKAQLEVSLAQIQQLQRIDWKIWEIYNQYIKK